MKVLPILQQAFPSATGYENLSTVSQANAEGNLVRVIQGDHVHIDRAVKDTYDGKEGLEPNSFSSSVPVTAFVKQVDARHYAGKKAWPDFRRTLMYARTEVRFYNEFLPDLQRAIARREQPDAADSSSPWSSSSLANRDITPQIYRAHCNLDGLLTEEEAATDPNGPGPVMVDWMTIGAAERIVDDATNAAGSNIQDQWGSYIVMEAIPDSQYFQDSPISLDQAKKTLAAAAALHAAAWEDTALLRKAQERLSRGSYHLHTRNPKELAGMREAWKHFETQFRGYDQALFGRCGDMGHRVQALANYICDATSPGPTDQYATLSHGDFKAMNCFLPVQPKETINGDATKNPRGVVMVDFASIGVGFGMSDVAMHIHHAVRPIDLACGGEMMLVDHYLDVLNRLLDEKQNNYPREVALRHYQLAVADYFRFFLGRFWKSATPKGFTKLKDSKNTALINRDVDAAMAFLNRVEEHVTQIELEKKALEGDNCSAGGVTTPLHDGFITGITKC